MLPPRALPHRFKGSAEGVVSAISARTESREPPCWVTAQSTVSGWRSSASSWSREPPELDGTESDEIEQGYLAVGADGEVRLRRKGERLLLTAKRGSGHLPRRGRGRARPGGLRATLAPDRRAPAPQAPTRDPAGRPQIEVDVYEGDLEGLVVAEIEFASEDEAVGIRAARLDRGGGHRRRALPERDARHPGPTVNRTAPRFAGHHPRLSAFLHRVPVRCAPICGRNKGMNPSRDNLEKAARRALSEVKDPRKADRAGGRGCRRGRRNRVPPVSRSREPTRLGCLQAAPA